MFEKNIKMIVVDPSLLIKKRNLERLPEEELRRRFHSICEEIARKTFANIPFEWRGEEYLTKEKSGNLLFKISFDAKKKKLLMSVSCKNEGAFAWAGKRIKGQGESIEREGRIRHLEREERNALFAELLRKHGYELCAYIGLIEVDTEEIRKTLPQQDFLNLPDLIISNTFGKADSCEECSAGSLLFKKYLVSGFEVCIEKTKEKLLRIWLLDKKDLEIESVREIAGKLRKQKRAIKRGNLRNLIGNKEFPKSFPPPRSNSGLPSCVQNSKLVNKIP